MHNHVPEVWEICIDEEHAHAVCEAISKGGRVTLGNLFQDPRDPDKALPLIALLLLRSNERRLLPQENLRLRIGDRLLLCGQQCARARMGWTLQNIHALGYILTGDSVAGGSLWRWISKFAGRRPAAKSRR